MADASRRQFVQQAAAIGAVVTGVAASPRRSFAANDTIGIGVIGTGGRARKRLMPGVLSLPGARIVGVCDVFDDHLEAGKFVASGRKKTDMFATRHHEELLARKDVDAVVIATPDHWHVPMTVFACEAGKDVYVEKPAAHKLGEGPAMIDAQNKHKRIVQVGAQQRSMPHLQAAKKIVQAGTLGHVHRIRMTWNHNWAHAKKPKLRIDQAKVDWKRFLGNAPEQAFDPFRMRWWRFIWDFGNGLVSDLGVHWLDTVQWMMDLEQPTRVTMQAGTHREGTGWETPDTLMAIWEFGPTKRMMTFESLTTSNSGAAGVELVGEKATLYFDRGRYELIPQPYSDVKPDQQIIGKGDRGADFYSDTEAHALHLAQWLDCVRTRQAPIEPAESGIAAAELAIRANMAFRQAHG
ncbi:Gfo/Idh/MocA family oxidoreductase [Planctomycetales bacterium ZRK34]|nr:Gfo/Idh/MocA family oxidoreductase [Planctomycetales bacterium ZRK34]